MIPRNTVNRFAFESGTDLHTAQQEVVLVYALEALRAGGVLRSLVFKGGSFLRLVILGRDSRFSEDLDFTDDGLGKSVASQVTTALHAADRGVSFKMEESAVSKEGNWRGTVAYTHDWDEGTFSVEVSARERVCLPPEPRPLVAKPYFRELPFPPGEVRSMALPEALAEKLRALHMRESERDYYDVVRYTDRGIPRALVRLLAAVKLHRARERFRPELILEKLQRGREDWVELRQLLDRRNRTDWNVECRQAADRLRFLRELTGFEQRLVADCRRHALSGAVQGEVQKALASIGRVQRTERATGAGRRLG